jgi:hypothetical protein
MNWMHLVQGGGGPAIAADGATAAHASAPHTARTVIIVENFIIALSLENDRLMELRGWQYPTELAPNWPYLKISQKVS